VTLFPTSRVKPSSRPPARDTRARTRIPTGTPRLVESSGDRASRAEIESWAALLDAVSRSSTARLELMKGRASSDRVPCGWQRLTGCDASCRCRGAGTVTIRFLRTHYERLALEIVLLVSPRSPA
jgi:hypothetical protein